MIDPGDFVKVASSSNIDSVGYDSTEEALYIKFIGRVISTYKYAGVSEAVFNELLDSDSKGKFVHTRIKGTYEYTKVS